MKCDEVRPHLPSWVKMQLTDEVRTVVREHLDGCEDCRQEEAAERALSDALESKLPRYAAPADLKRKVAAIVAKPGADRAPRSRTAPWGNRFAKIMTAVAAAALLSLGPLAYENAALRDEQASASLTGEAVNDHLRVLEGERPLEVVSSGIHEVKPWFAGKVDFAPRVAFAGDADFPLAGGTVTRFLDRKAATLVYKRRLHTISLFVFRADGLAWPTSRLVDLGSVKARTQTERGYTVIEWRDRDLGYALVSDVDPKELAQLPTRITPPP